MNVLVYSGPGTTIDSVKSCTDTLRRLLSPYYCILTVSPSTIADEPWASSTSLLVIPGGADLPYCAELRGKGNEAIIRFVRRGGRYIGFCAGGYYGSSRVEFEVGNPTMEVSGSRDLKLFPGTCRGAAFEGFQYGTQKGVRAAAMKVNTEKLKSASDFHCYYNGGGVFVDAEKYANDGVEILAEYEEDIRVDSGLGKAAVVYCKVGKGCAIVTGPHPEYSSVALSSAEEWQEKSVVRDILKTNESQRLNFMRELFIKMGLKVNEEDNPVPNLSRLFLSARHPESLRTLIEKLRTNVGFTGESNNLLKDNNDTFRLLDANKGLFEEERTEENLNGSQKDNLIQKDVDIYYTGRPNPRQSPYFNHELYYTELDSLSSSARGELGSFILYGEVVTSTSTMLDKNYNILSQLPNGFAAVGTVQIAGRGRGSNVWVNPPGVLAVSMVLRFPIAFGELSPIVFIQYLTSLAMVEAVRGYGPGYQEMPIRLKWPNDMYASNPEYDNSSGGTTDEPEYLKVGGVIVNTTVIDGEHVLVFGLGINVFNVAPSTSINQILGALNTFRRRKGKAELAPYRIEILLARFTILLEQMLMTFKYQGFKAFEDLYYSRWLHADKIVTLEHYGNTKAIIRGITMDSGLLIAEEVDRENRPSGRRIELQPDGNSFDMLKGLLKRKI